MKVEIKTGFITEYKKGTIIEVESEKKGDCYVCIHPRLIHESEAKVIEEKTNTNINDLTIIK